MLVLVGKAILSCREWGSRDLNSYTFFLINLKNILEARSGHWMSCSLWV